VPPAIRIARLDDVTRIVELTAQLGYDVSQEAADERLRRILQRPDDRFLVADDEGAVVGWLHAVVADYLETGPFVVIAGLVVDRTMRKRGIGGALLSAAEQWAVERGCQIVRLWSSAARTEAHRFYERLGYAHIKTQFSFVKSVGTAGPREFAAFIPRIDA
jgi:GNAT superfamily N-acetyltransferase